MPMVVRRRLATYARGLFDEAVLYQKLCKYRQGLAWSFTRFCSTDVGPGRRRRGRDAESTLRDVLFQPGSREALYEAIREHLPILTFRNAATALRSLAHLQVDRVAAFVDNQPKTASGRPHSRPPSHACGADGADTGPGSSVRPEEQALAEHLRKQLGADGAQNLPIGATVSIAWSLAKLSGRAPFDSLLDPLCTRLADAASKGVLGARDVSTAFWAVEGLGLANERQELLATLGSALVASADAGSLSAHDIALSLWAAARLDEASSPGMVRVAMALVKAAAGKASVFNAHSTSITLWSIGLMEKIHGMEETRQLVAEMAEAATEYASGMNSQMISNCAWGAARCMFTSEPFFAALATTATRQLRLKEPTDQHVCNVVWAYAKVETQSVPVQKHLLAVCDEVHLLKSGRANHVAGTAWALAKCFCGDITAPEDGAAPAPVLSAVSIASAHALTAVDDWPPRELAMVSWAVARVQLTEEPLSLLPAVVDRLAHAPPGVVRCQDFTMVLWAIATARLCNEHFSSRNLEALVASGLRDLRAAPPHAMNTSQAAWACAKADLRGVADELLDEAARIAAVALERGSWSLRHLTMVAWSVVARGVYTAHSAAFVRDVYIQGMEALQRQDSASVDEQTHQISTLGAALHVEAGLRGTTLPRGFRLPAPCAAVAAASDPEVRPSQMQEQVLDVLRSFGLASRLEVEATVWGFSIDAVLRPRRHISRQAAGVRPVGT